MTPPAELDSHSPRAVRQTPESQNGDRRTFLAEYKRLLKAVREDHDNSTRHLELARFLLKHGYIDRAQSSLLVARALQPRRLEIHYLLGQIYTKQANHEQEKLTYRSILQIKPNEPKAHFHLGKALLSLGQKDEAYEALLKAVELHPELNEAYWHLGELAVERKEYEQALSHYQVLKSLEPDSPKLYHELGRIQQLRGLEDRAVAAYEKCLALLKEHLPARLALAGLYLDSDLPSKARELLEIVMDWEQRPADAYILLSRSHKDEGNLDKAIAILLEMANIFPIDPRSFRELARLYHLKGEHEIAEEEFLKALSLDPGNRELVVELGTLYLTMKLPSKAISLYVEALKGFPNDPGLYSLLSEVYDRFDKTDQAIECLNAAIEGNPSLDSLYLKRGRFFIKTGVYERAMADFEKARTINPRSSEAQMDLDLIRGHQKHREASDLFESAMRAIAAGDYAQALNHMRTVTRLVPDRVEWLEEYLDIALRSGKFGEALAVFEQLELLDPQGFSVFRRHADLCYQLHEYERAHRLYTKATELDSENLPCRIGVIRCNRHLLIEKAIPPDTYEILSERLLSSLSSSRQPNLVLLEVAYLNMSMGALLRPAEEWSTKALEALKEIRPNETEEVSLLKWLGLLEVHRKTERDRESIETLESLRRQYPHKLDYGLAQVDYLFLAKDYARAYQLSEELRQKFPKNGLMRAKSLKIVAKWAEISPEVHRLTKERLEELRQHVARNPGDILGLFELAMGLWYLTKPTEGVERRKKIQIALTKAKALAQKSVWPWWGLIKTSLSLPGENPTVAEISRQAAQIRNALSLFPGEACLHYYLGRVLHMAPDAPQSDLGTASLKTATLVNPCFAAAEYELGVHYMEARDQRRAYHYFSRVLESVAGCRYQGLVQRHLRRLVP